MSRRDSESTLASAALLIVRVGAGGLMLIQHGWGKLMAFGEKSSGFPDPLGVGNTTSMALAVGAEVFASILLILGLLTRLAAIPLLFTMFVAAVIIHAADPFQKKELAILYGLLFLALVVAGGGRFSLDRVLRERVPRALARLMS